MNELGVAYLRKKIEGLESRIATLESALKKCGGHTESCALSVWLALFPPKPPRPACDCGFDAALTPTQEPQG